MKLLIVRHGDPDYVNDSLTEKGKREAAYAAERIAKLDVKQFYVSPLGRARATAAYTLEKMGRTAEECLWLREFAPKAERPDWKEGMARIAWDWLPQDWMGREEFYRYDRWYGAEEFRRAKVKEEYDWVVSGLDGVLAKHGYVREGHYYRAVQPNQDTIVFFCHFGLECVLLSHLLNISPMPLWHGTCAAPTSVTTLVTEERREGIAAFRMSSFGDISHLYVKEEEPAFSARFCEMYTNKDERHD